MHNAAHDLDRHSLQAHRLHWLAQASRPRVPTIPTGQSLGLYGLQDILLKMQILRNL